MAAGVNDRAAPVRFVALDGLRGVAAACVLIHHLILWHTSSHFLSGGGLAVDFFFCLSGFVIAHAYGEKLAQGMGFIAFIAARLRRLYPLIALGFVIGAGVYTLVALQRTTGGPEELIAIAKSLPLSLLLIPHEQPAILGIMFPLNTPTWSIFFELVINVVFAAAILILGRKRSRWLFIAMAIAAVLIATRWGSVLAGFSLETLKMGLVRVTISFFIGALVYDRIGSPPPEKQAANDLLFLPLAAAVVGVMAVESVWPGIVWQLISLCLIFPAVIALGSRVRPVRSKAVLSLLGDLSYPLYILHRPLVVLIVGLSMGIAAPPAVRLVAVGLCVTGISWLILKFYDEPVRAWLAARGRARRLKALPDTA